MLPVVDPPAQSSGSASVYGVIFAAGMSSRYGETNKLLVSVNDDRGPDSKIRESNDNIGESIVRCSIQTFLNCNLSKVFVVVGHESGRIRQNLSGLDIEVIENQAYASGHASSVHAAVEAINDRSIIEKPVDAVVFGLGDMPYVDSESVRALVQAYENDVGSALAAGYNGQRGNPVLFDRQYFDELLDCSGDNGGKEVLLSASDGTIIQTDDPGVLKDINKPSEI
jgi:molybdenum cofactor cytidylyltransferase